MSEILGVLFAIFVGILVIPKFGDYQKASNDNTRAAVTAQQQKQLNAAATTYIQQNSVAIQATATSTTPVIITVAMLQAAGVDLLPAAFSATNPYGQIWQVEVLQPTAGNLQVLSMSTGGTALSDAQATKISTIVGAAGGFIPQNDSGIYPGAAANAYGAFAGWTIPTTNYTGIAGGHPAALLSFNNGQLQNNYLYRNAVPSQPQLNTMNTPLIMASVQTPGTACSPNGAIAQDGSGTALSCQNAVWQSNGTCIGIPSTTDLNTIEVGARCYNGTGNANSPAGADWFFMEEYRHINAANYYTVQRVAGMTGPSAGKIWHRNQQSGTPGTGWGSWVQQADNQVSIWDQPNEGGVITMVGANGIKIHMENLNGTFRLVNDAWNAQLFSVDQSGNVTASRLGLGGYSPNSGYPAGWGGGLHTWDAYAEGSVGAGTGGSVNASLDRNGNIYSNNTATLNALNGNLQVTATAAEGSACTGEGRIASSTTTSGLILSCQSGVWSRAFGGGWKNLSLSDTNPFNPQCSYIFNGMRASYVDSIQIMAVVNTISPPTTATWRLINSGNKSIVYIAQDNYANYTYYGGAAVSSISYSCP